MIQTEKVWHKGQTPEDLPAGRYRFVFLASDRLIKPAYDLILKWHEDRNYGGTVKIADQSCTLLDVTRLPFTNGDSELWLDCEVVGFWPQFIAVVLATIGVLGLGYLYLTRIERIIKTPGGAAVAGVSVLAVAGAAIVALLVLGRPLAKALRSG